ncbi:hypothetical protein CBOM_05583 [Ceraceosorus bombacis]|uniref:Uncharacterized protein n=1 Tax=Ceraceosorus bombacis TaxID=401625 RepID=A0A0P1BQX8_9BASI|nr:hypothetical protein CBOM_05583 [Ceraceosorus bombacis]
MSHSTAKPPPSLGLFPTTSFRPKSSTAQGAGLRTRHGNGKAASGLNGAIALLKDNFSLSTWLLIGMTIQVFISLFTARRWAFDRPGQQTAQVTTNAQG